VPLSSSRSFSNQKMDELSPSQRKVGPADSSSLNFRLTSAAVRGAKWPIDPPPVIELIVHDNDPTRSYLHSPFWFCTAQLDPNPSNRQFAQSDLLVGCLSSSLHKVKLSDNKGM